MTDSDDDSIKSSRSGKSMTSAAKSIKSIKSNYNNKGNDMLKGKIEELGNNVYTYGNRYSGDYYNKVTENIGDYAAREYSKYMRSLIVDGIENKPKAPTRPKVKKDEEVDPFVMKEYELDHKDYKSKLNKCIEDKQKILFVIKGQCTEAMVSKLETDKNYKKIMADDNVIGLMKLIKTLSHENNETKYDHWNVTGTMIKLYKIKQKPNEKLIIYYKRFINLVEIAEVQGGLITSDVLAKKENNYSSNKDAALQKCRNKYLACLFLRSVDWNKHGNCIKELNNLHLAGHNNYPTTISEAVNYLSNYMDNNRTAGKKEWHDGGDNEEAKSFVQSTNTLRCFNCGEPGYTKKTCPKCNKDKSLLNVVDGVPDWMINE